MAQVRSHAKRTRVFIGYSHHDHKWLQRLTVHLKPLVRNHILDLWDDTRLAPGDDWRSELASALKHAKAAVLLITADFLASDFICEEELPPLLAAAAKGGCRVIPIIIGPCIFPITSLAKFQSINPPGRPLTSMREHDQEDALRQVALALLPPSGRIPDLGQDLIILGLAGL